VDDIDIALFEAWNRLSDRVRADRAERLRRLARRDLRSMRAPMRVWCLAVRAADSRIAHEVNCDITPFKDLDRYRQDHTVTIRAPGIRALCAPVNIDWPGIPADVALARLGRHRSLAVPWIRRGIFQVRYDYARVWSRRPGKKVPVVWSPTPLDPAADGGSPAPDVFRGVWQSNCERVPDDLRLHARRVRSGRGFASYWKWQCPGLDGVRCGRTADILYAPLPELRLQQLLGDPLRDIAGDPRLGANTAFACGACHQLTSITLATPGEWNRFVTRVSGGLLYGHEVPLPASLRIRPKGPPRKKRRPDPRVAAQRSRVRMLVGEGKSIREIQAALGIGRTTVKRYLDALRREHGGADRMELARILAGEPPQGRRKRPLRNAAHSS
jgi:hypothetical protein